MKKILTSPSSFGQISGEPYDLITNNGYKIVKNPYGRTLTEDEIIEIASDCVGIVAGVEPLTSRVMDALPNLKCISRVGVGMDSVDLGYAAQKGIKVVNTPDGPTRPVAEMTLAMVFSLLRKIPQADANMKAGVWKKEIGNLLFGKTIGVIGLGRIGKLVAESFNNLGNVVIGYDLYPDESWAFEHNVKIITLEEVIKTADIVTLHVPPKKDRTFIVDKQLLSKIKHTAFLINLARGGIVDEEQLIFMLQNDLIAGAAIDVFSKEPYDGPFTQLQNVVLTPHMGSYAAEGKLQMEIDAVNNLIKGLN